MEDVMGLGGKLNIYGEICIIWLIIIIMSKNNILFNNVI